MRQIFGTAFISVQKKDLEVLFIKIGNVHIQIYSQTPIEAKYGAFYLNNEVRVHGLVLLVQQS